MEKQKGLNVPKIIRNTPLDNKFSELAGFLEVDESSNDDIITQLYNKIANNQLDNDNRLDKLGKYRILIPICFNYMKEIQSLAIENSLSQKKSTTQEDQQYLISISLHDMKTFTNLLNLIIIQFIYSFLPSSIGIPIAERRLKSFNEKHKLYNFKKFTSNNKTTNNSNDNNNDSNENNDILICIINEFYQIFENGGDIRDLLIKGSGLTDILTILIVLINDYDSSLIEKLIYFENSSDSYNLFGIYTILIQSTKIPNYKKLISDRLTNLTLNRNDGVLNLIDYIVGIRDDEEINIEKFNHVNTILMKKPKEIPSIEYFTKIFNQIYDILIFINRPVFISVAINFIKVIYQKNKRIIHDFLFNKIWNCLDTDDLTKFKDDDIIIDAKKLNDCINVLISLTKESSKEFLNELFGPIILKLWNYYMYLTKKNLEYSTILLNILTSFFTITSNNEMLENIILNLIQINGEDWKFQTHLENKLTSIVKINNKFTNEFEISNEEIFDDIDLGLKNIISLFKNLNDDIVIHQFLKVLNRWILQESDESKKNSIDTLNPFIILIDLKLLEKINEEFKDVLMDKPQEVLLVIKNLLTVKFEEEEPQINEQDENEPDSDDEDDEEEEQQHSNNLTLLLELLSAIISETNPIELQKYNVTLKEISKILLGLSSNKQCESLHFRIEEFLNNETKKLNPIDDKTSQDKELFKKAIININDPLIPIRAHGLYLLRQLIMKKSPVLSLDMVLELHIIQLHDSEPFIYLNVIKSLNELIEFDEISTIKYLLNYYVDKNQSINDRLKIGEVILNYILKSNEMFNGNLVDEIISTTLNVIRDFKEDNRLRMSSMSLIGQALRTNAIGIENFIKDSLDCSIGILEFEKDNIMKRSSVILINDLLSFGGLELIPKGYGKKLKILLEYTKLNCDDYLLIEQINQVLEIIGDLIKEKFTPSNQILPQFETLKIVK